MVFFFEDNSADWNIDNDIFSVFTILVFNTAFFTIIGDEGFAMSKVKEYEQKKPWTYSFFNRSMNILT